MSRRLSVAALSALLLVLPFEPRRPTLPLFGLELTLLEGAAGAAILALLYANRDRVGLLRRRPPLPLLLLWAWVAANGLAAALAPVNRVLAAKFVLRMAGAGMAALAVAAAPRDVPRRAAPALTVACAAVAVLAILEACGARGLDGFLDRFRDGAYVLGDGRRATGGSENPNLAAAILMYGLVPAVGLAALARRPARRVVPVTAVFAAGVLLTHSRGGLAALGAALAVLGLSLASRRLPARGPALALATMLAVGAAFALSGGSVLRPFPRMTGPGYAVRYAPGERALSLAPRERRAVTLTLTNTGTRAWSGGALGCSWLRAEETLDTDWQATSVCPVTRVPAADAGQTLAIEANVRAPDAEGRYRLIFDLTADGWVLSSLGTAPAAIAAVVSRNPAAAPAETDIGIPAQATFDRGRGALWRAAVSIWKERPLTGIGPDNFRWVHAGHAAWPGRGPHDTLVPANNMFLEAAANTGTLGLLALLATLAATVHAARARLRAPGDPADEVCGGVLLALVTGIAVHGLVDSFLGFTGHYLFLGLVVGAASSPSEHPGPRPARA